MFSWLVGSTADLKAKITDHLKTNPYYDPTNKGDIKKLTAQIWGANKPWFDLFGWIAEARQGKIQVALTLARQERKIDLLSTLAGFVKEQRKAGKTPHQINTEIFLNPDFQIFTAKDRQLFSALNSFNFSSAPNPSTWRSWTRKVANAFISTIPEEAQPQIATALQWNEQKLLKVVKAFQTKNLSEISEEEKSVIGSAVLTHRLYPNQIYLRSPSLTYALSQIEQSPAFDTMLQEMISTKWREFLTPDLVDSLSLSLTSW